MAVTVITGTFSEAEEWIKASPLPSAEQAHLLRFVRRFPELEFLKQTLGGTPPAWLIEQAGTLRGISTVPKQLVWVQFDGFDYPLPHVSLTDTWYRFAFQGTVDASHPEVFYDEKRVYFVGVDMENYNTMLAILFNESDKQVYEFDYKAVRPNQEDLEDGEEEADYQLDGFGHIEPEQTRVAFDSYSSMLGHIIAIRLQDGRIFKAKS